MKNFFHQLERKIIDIGKSIFIPDLAARFWKNREHILHNKNGNHIVSLFCKLSNQAIFSRLNCNRPCQEGINRFATPHGLTGIFISSGAKIGKGCTIFQQVTIGSNTLKDSAGGVRLRLVKMYILVPERKLLAMSRLETAFALAPTVLS